MINYTCQIEAYKDQTDDPRTFNYTIESEYSMTPRRIKEECMKRLPLGYTKVGPLKILGEHHE